MNGAATGGARAFGVPATQCGRIAAALAGILPLDEPTTLGAPHLRPVRALGRHPQHHLDRRYRSDPSETVHVRLDDER